MMAFCLKQEKRLYVARMRRKLVRFERSEIVWGIYRSLLGVWTHSMSKDKA